MLRLHPVAARSCAMDSPPWERRSDRQPQVMQPRMSGASRGTDGYVTQIRHQTHVPPQHTVGFVRIQHGETGTGDYSQHKEDRKNTSIVQFESTVRFAIHTRDATQRDAAAAAA